MIDLTSLIESIEKLAYNILMWALLIPRTLLKIIFNPGWVPEYVDTQLKVSAMDDRFGDYFSPVILILLATLLPFVYSYVTAPPAVTLNAPLQAPINTDVNFDATSKFISNVGDFTYAWTADQVDDWSDVSEQNKDFVSINWSTPGWKLVTVTASNASLESYYDEFYIFIIDPRQTGAQTGAQDSPTPPVKPSDLLGTLEGPTGILAALAFLSIPLLFAIATDAFRGRTLTRSSLMRSFFIQCYYFSPFGLAAWSLIIGKEYLLTPREAGLTLLALAVVVVMLVWLLRNETNLIAREREISRPRAFLIVLACLFGILGAAGAIALLQANAELLRLSLGWFYAAAVAVLVLVTLAHRLHRLRKKGPSVSPAEQVTLESDRTF